MKRLYSSSTGGLYLLGVHKNVPSDAIEINDDRYQEILSGKQKVSISDQRATAKKRIDAAAGSARNRFVSTGVLIEEEYRAAALDVERWRSAGSDPDVAPDSLSIWAQISGQTLEQAASEIEQTAAGYRSALLAIRKIRLSAKAEIDAAEAGIDEITEVALQLLADIKP